MFSKFGRELFAPAVTRVVNWLKAAGISPNTITIAGFLLTALSAIVLAGGAFRWGAILLLIASVFDMLDGALARATAQISAFGAFLDSTLDRYSESVTFLALAYYFSGLPDARTETLLILITVIGSLMVSYTRARAEALNVECKAGVLQRPERVILLIAGLLIGWVQPVLWIMALLTNISAIQRIYEVYTNTRQRDSAAKVARPTEQPPQHS
jgi:CDP-diacylglycerol--glycerol-3-phosphate 3-phosphatidyltransferase